MNNWLKSKYNLLSSGLYSVCTALVISVDTILYTYTCYCSSCLASIATGENTPVKDTELIDADDEDGRQRVTQLYKFVPVQRYYYHIIDKINLSISVTSWLPRIGFPCLKCILREEKLLLCVLWSESSV